MATALDIIKRSMRLLRLLGENEDPTTSEAEDGLTALNSMLDAWNIDRLMTYQVASQNFSWPASTASRTIGPSGNFNTVRPVKIESAYFRDADNEDFELTILNYESYDRIALKSVEATYPEYLYYDPGYTLGTIYLADVPSSTFTLYIRTWTPFTAVASIATTVALPPGYKRAIEYNLAAEMAPEFGVEPSADVRRIAMESKRSIKSSNSSPIIGQLDCALTGGGGSDIFSGV